jgi:hypothetical protein
MEGRFVGQLHGFRCSVSHTGSRFGFKGKLHFESVLNEKQTMKDLTKSKPAEFEILTFFYFLFAIQYY